MREAVMSTRRLVAATVALVAALVSASGAQRQEGTRADSAAFLQIVDELQTPGLETELSGIYPHPTDDNLYFVVTNGEPPYQPSMKPLLPERLRNKLLTVNRRGEVVKTLDLPNGGGLFGDLAFGNGHLWLGPLEPPALWKLDLNTGHVVARYPLPGPAGGMEFDRARDQIIVQSYIGHPHLAIVDPHTGVVIKSLWSDENCQGVAKVGGDLLTTWTSSWDANAYSELWHLDENTGRPKSRTRLQGVHAAMAPLDPKVAGFEGFMSLVHVGSAVSGKTVIRRYKYISEARRTLIPPSNTPRQDVFAAVTAVPPSVAPDRRRNTLLAMTAEAARSGARYIVLPEHGISGPLTAAAAADVQRLAEPIPGETTHAFARIAREFRVWIAVPVIERGDPPSGYFVSTALVDPSGEVALVVRKRIMRHDGADGSAEPGFARVLLETADDEGRRIGVLSGDDLQAGVPRLAERGADAILVSANWARGDQVDWSALAASLAREHRVHIVVSNRDPRLSAIYRRDGITLGTQSSSFVSSSLPTETARWSVRSSLGLPSVPIAVDRPFTPGLVELGRSLFFDPVLSSTGTVSCASCHKPERFFSNGEATGEGVHGRRTRRNVPSLLNVAFKSTLHWDGNPTTLEQQVKYPLGGFDEMDLAASDALRRALALRPQYLAAFERELGVKGEDLDREHVALALASFQRTFVSADSLFDRYQYGGDTGALATEAIRGLEIFRGVGGCASCHTIGSTSAIFIDGRFHRLGIGYVPEKQTYQDTGVGTVSNSRYSGMFFTPSLRNVAETAPYLHDGSAPTLEAAIRAHSLHPELDPALPREPLDAASLSAVLAFLKSLTGSERYDGRGERSVEMRAAGGTR
jgi:cytochrome c peroxidase